MNSSQNSGSGYKQKLDALLGKIRSLPNDSLEKTIAVAVGVSLFCAVFVSLSAVALRPLQVANKKLDIDKNIVTVAGLISESEAGEADLVRKALTSIETRIVDLETGEFTDAIDVNAFDARKAAGDPELGMEIPRQDDVAHIKRRAKYAKVYLVKGDGKDKLDALILPVSGYGLWSTMYGFLALEADGETVRGINFYDQAETPGLGGEVVNPKWRAIWKGKKIFNKQGEPVLGLIKGNVDPSKPGSEYQVDGLAGATLTSQGVSNLIKYWLGESGFGPFLEKFKQSKPKTLEGAA
ncbi:MAG TPA: Na(+)-translocating NADH-quinone reductase subunit C [Crenotrichaceae bacterium]|nr:Na(+)-translocating NADH-quinone reductase subunit C [Crenotrichaceae bacterium]